MSDRRQLILPIPPPPPTGGTNPYFPGESARASLKRTTAP